MAINLATGFSIGSKDVIDERQVLTLNQMQNLDENVYPDNYFAICKDDGKLYLFNTNNVVDATYGKFRVLTGGTGGGDTTYVLPPATDTTLGGVKVDNVTITVDSEGVITAINSYTKTEVDDLLNNKLDKPAVDGTAGQILVLQDDGSLAYADIPGSGNVDDIQEEIDKKLDKPIVDGTAGQILVLQDDGSLAYEDNVGSGTTDLTEINNKLAQLENKTKHKSIATITVNSKTFKIDIDKVSSGLNGNIKFGYCVDNGYGEIIIYSLGASSVMWIHSTGPRYVNSVTYTIDPDNTTHITIGVEFYNTIYGVHQIETPSNFATINSFTGESYTGTSVATIGGVRGRNSGVGIIYDVADLGLTLPCTTVQIAQAMRQLAYGTSTIPRNGMIGIFDNGKGKITDAPTSYGLLQVNATGADSVLIRFDGVGASSYAGSWIGQIKAPSAGAAFSSITWKRIDNVSTVDLTNINTKLTQLETNQIKNINLIDMEGDYPIYKIKPSGTNNISKISLVDLYGGCILITGSAVPSYKPFKVVRLSNGNWESYYPSLTGANKIDKVYYNGSFIYVKCNQYIKCYIEGGFETVEKITSLPTGVTELPILDLTQRQGQVAVDNPSDLNLNNYIESGNYGIGVPANYSNIPEVSSGLLTVTRSNAIIKQVYTTAADISMVYYRTSSTQGITWMPWKSLNDSSGGNTNNDVYSTEEQAVGTWVNGKTLYRRTIEDNTLREAGTDFIKLFDYNTDMKIVKYEGVVTLNNNNGQTFIRSLPYSKDSEEVYVTKTTLDTLRLDSYLTNYKLGGYIVSVYYYKN